MLRSTFARTRLALILASTLPGLCVPLLASGAEQPAAQKHHFNIAPGSLISVLNRFAEQSGVFLAGHNDLAADRRSPGLVGDYTEQQALRRLLQGSGVQAQAQNSGGYVLRAAPSATGPLELDATTVSGKHLGAITEGTQAYTTGQTSSATGLPLSLRETPQSVTVITRQQLDDQGATGIADILRRAPGISVQNYDSERWEFSSRGAPITNFQYDGVNTDYDGVYDYGTTSTDMAPYDRVEIIKGATGLMTGSGDPSATVNLIRKRPTEAFKASVSGTVGSWDNARGEADIGGPLTADGHLRGRFVGVLQQRSAYADHYRNDKDIAYGILEADLSPDTLLSVGFDQQNTRSRGASWTGFPMFHSDGSRTHFSRSFNPATDWSRRDFSNQTLFAALSRQLANDWTFKLSYDRKHRQHDTLLGSASGGNPDPVSGDGMFLYMGRFQGDEVQDNFDLNLSGPFSLFGREHQLLAGFMSMNTRQDIPVYGSVYPALGGSIFDWRGEFAKPDIPQVGRDDIRQRQTGAYLATRLKPTNDLALILGGRVSDFTASDHLDYRDPTRADVRDGYRQTGVLTPYAGVVYDLDDRYSLYSSYTRIYQPQMSKDASRQVLEPVQGNSLEAGVKAEYFDGRLNAGFAVFRIEQDNIAEYVSGFDSESVYRPVQGATTKGFEFELAGELREGWNLSAGYAFNHTRDAKGEPVYGAILQTTAPEQIVRVFSSYRLPGAWQNLTLGAGVSWQSEFFGNVFQPDPADTDNGGHTVRITQDSYYLVDAMARYRFNEHLSTTLNVKNLLDTTYYTGLGNFGTGFYGEPRNVQLTTRWDF
ncbi:TonB-dependent receptor [Pseudomonas sp. B2M1-30]|uniref:TonB-dependent siderophore receptor n=1 Tax=Pseudomonas TaxID=286 RepID=UPI0021C7F73D|nr:MULTISPECIES: TonB-dependent receptor [Pseudomonas]MCU0120023.1 TonB-dependent receptor [Pseudomonas sp. B2M1-30]MCU7262034.1 TonB-dependent receptor [Pseudomonas koreensis]